jgi:hypothetical protein
MGPMPTLLYEIDTTECCGGHCAKAYPSGKPHTTTHRSEWVLTEYNQIYHDSSCDSMVGQVAALAGQLYTLVDMLNRMVADGRIDESDVPAYVDHWMITHTTGDINKLVRHLNEEYEAEAAKAETEP